MPKLPQLATRACAFAGFLNLGTVDALGQRSLWCKDCPVHCRVFSSVPGLHPLDAKNIPDICPGGQNCSLLRTTGLKIVKRISHLPLGMLGQEFSVGLD